MREYIALEVIKNQQKRAIIDEFIDSLDIQDITFRELLKQYMYPHLTGTLFKKDYYERGEHEIVVLTPEHRYGVELRIYYEPLRAKLVTLIAGTTASDLSWLQIVDAMQKEFKAFKTAYSNYKETGTNNKELWLQYIRFDIMRYYFSDVVRHEESIYNLTFQDYEETLLPLDKLLEPFGVSFDIRRKKEYNYDTFDGCVSYMDDMIKFFDVALPFIYNGLKENKFKHYHPLVTELDLYEYDHSYIFDDIAAKEFRDTINNIDKQNRLCLSNETYSQTLKQIEAYVRTHIKNETYCNLICRYIKDGHPFEEYSDRLLFYYRNDNEIKCDELMQEFATYIIGSPFSGTNIEQASPLYDIVVREFRSFEDIFIRYKNNTATAIDLFLQYARYHVVTDWLDTLILRHIDYEVFEISGIDCPDITTFDFNLNTKESCIDNIEANMEYLKPLHASIHEAIATNNQPLLYQVACKLGVIVLNLYNPVLSICDKY